MRRYNKGQDHIKNLKELPEALRNSLVISRTKSGRVLSRYEDPEWDFKADIHVLNKAESKKKIVFSSLVFSDGSRLTDPKHVRLLESTKAYLYVRMVMNSANTGKPWSKTTIIDFWGVLRPLLRWMVDSGYACFADITPASCLVYVAHTQKRTTWEHVKGGRKGKKLSVGFKYNLFACVEDLWRLREQLQDSLRKNPWPGQSAGSLAGVKAGLSNRFAKTEQIPDRLMSKLMQEAFNYVEEGYGEQLLACRDARSSGWPIDGHLVRFGLKGWRAVTVEITRLRTACYVVIDALSGLRDSEMGSLETGCYYEHEGWDGAAYGWIKGYTYKFEEDPKPGEWMVPPVVAKAVELASQIAAPLWEELENQIRVLEVKLEKLCYMDPILCKQVEDALHEMKRHRQALFISKASKDGNIRRLSSTTMRQCLKDFARHSNLCVQASDLDQVRNKAEIKVGDIWPLAPHQFRKTFARYIARCTLGDIRYLREHFKHWSLDMTLMYAQAEETMLDDTLFAQILTERQAMQDDIVWGWLNIKTNQHLAGVGGKAIEKVRGNSLAMVAKNSKAVARQLSQGFFLRGLGHSWCTEKECNGKGLYSVTECSDCDNRVIDESHKLTWYGICEQQIDLMKLGDCGDPMWQGALDSLRFAEQVLRDLGEEIVPYPAPPKPSERRPHV